MTEPGAQRLFFALWPGEPVRPHFVRLAQGLADRGRLPHPEDIHLTLVFLGDVAANRLDCVLGAGGVVHAPPFDLCIDRLGFWPRPRVLWCGPSAMPSALLTLVRDLQQGLRGCGFEPEPRLYQAHITLVRKARSARELHIDEPFHWPVSDLVLAASETVDTPPRYRILRRWALAG